MSKFDFIGRIVFQVIRGLSSDAENDTILRKILGEIFTSTIQALQDLRQSGDTLMGHLEQCFDNLSPRLVNEESNLLSESIKCPIMVLGKNCVEGIQDFCSAHIVFIFMVTNNWQITLYLQKIHLQNHIFYSIILSWPVLHQKIS